MTGTAIRSKKATSIRWSKSFTRAVASYRVKTPAVFGAFEQALSSSRFDSAVAIKGQIEGPITFAAYLFQKDKLFLADPALLGR